ncbi:hypothetical protein B0H16DRAFT_1723134 [Mycena metata]|uniref:Uncharacterized protein n=1 Tax=Mycena metata TaxID=1033252 RepID=A0AAD7J206_9AGAR|nr:hypothetical protein B0H16DRAFT_1723134 [Mycena metata]
MRSDHIAPATAPPPRPPYLDAQYRVLCQCSSPPPASSYPLRTRRPRVLLDDNSLVASQSARMTIWQMKTDADMTVSGFRRTTSALMRSSSTFYLHTFHYSPSPVMPRPPPVQLAADSVVAPARCPRRLLDDSSLVASGRTERILVLRRLRATTSTSSSPGCASNPRTTGFSAAFSSRISSECTGRRLLRQSPYSVAVTIVLAILMYVKDLLPHLAHAVHYYTHLVLRPPRMQVAAMGVHALGVLAFPSEAVIIASEHIASDVVLLVCASPYTSSCPAGPATHPPQLPLAVPADWPGGELKSCQCAPLRAGRTSESQRCLPARVGVPLRSRHRPHCLERWVDVLVPRQWEFDAGLLGSSTARRVDHRFSVLSSTASGLVVVVWTHLSFADGLRDLESTTRSHSHTHSPTSLTPHPSRIYPCIQVHPARRTDAPPVSGENPNHLSTPRVSRHDERAVWWVDHRDHLLVPQTLDAGVAQASPCAGIHPFIPGPGEDPDPRSADLCLSAQLGWSRRVYLGHFPPPGSRMGLRMLDVGDE